MTVIDRALTTRQVQLSDGSALDLSIEEHATTTSVVARDAAGQERGTAWFELADTGRPNPVVIYVDPAHRRLGLGTALLRTLVDVASARGFGWLVCSEPEDGRTVAGLAHAGHVVCARRVGGGVTKTVLLVPAAA